MKLTLVIVLNGSFALLLAGFLLLGYEKFALRRAAASELGIQAAVVADSSTAPLIFNDERAAKETLAALRRNPDLTEAAIYDRDSHLFAWYRERHPHQGVVRTISRGRRRLTLDEPGLISKTAICLFRNPSFCASCTLEQSCSPEA